MIWPRGHMGVEALTSLSGTQCICIFIHRLGRRKHARKQLTRQIENKHRKNTYRCWIHILYHRISKKHKLHVSVCCWRIFDLSTNLNGISFAPIASIDSPLSASITPLLFHCWQILPTVVFLLFFWTDSTDSPDYLPILPSLSVVTLHLWSHDNMALYKFCILYYLYFLVIFYTFSWFRAV